MILIIGLGNIGNEYTNTRHNIGFNLVDQIANEYNFPEWKKKSKYLFTKGNINNIEIILLKPTTYMNLSGEALKSFLTQTKIPAENIIVIHDDLDVKIGDVKFKIGGGNAGHNGLKSIDSAVGKDYNRIRIGISHPRDNDDTTMMDVADYVLGKFKKEDTEKLKPIFKKIINDLPIIIDKNS